MSGEASPTPEKGRGKHRRAGETTVFIFNALCAAVEKTLLYYFTPKSWKCTYDSVLSYASMAQFSFLPLLRAPRAGTKSYSGRNRL